MKYKKAKEKKKRKRLKKVYSARTLLHVYLEGKIPEGWTRDGSQSMEGRHYYAGRGPERVKIASKFQGFLWVHPVSRYLRNYPDFEYWYQEVPTDGDYGCPVAEAVLKGFLHKDAVDKPVWKRRWNNPPVNNVFVVPLVPQSTSAHLANAEYLADLAQSHRNISRLKKRSLQEGSEAFRWLLRVLWSNPARNIRGGGNDENCQCPQGVDENTKPKFMWRRLECEHHRLTEPSNQKTLAPA